MSAGRENADGNAPWERVCWAKAKRRANLRIAGDLVIWALLQRFCPHLRLLLGEDAHAAPTKRLNAIVRLTRSRKKRGRLLNLTAELTAGLVRLAS
ncbi:hypothetical protein [Neptuniibacter sp.]|uniref:hypothetical protein n=1 Tax=Neptuniibacter sp. TaxID=1962643 RepID=UPI002628689E|nr:hypothetical protein [Neptuniibacter sp.]MCP4594861.1 hypothetical protein [Neptuniibacter sp.]